MLQEQGRKGAAGTDASYVSIVVCMRARARPLLLKPFATKVTVRHAAIVSERNYNEISLYIRVVLSHCLHDSQYRIQSCSR